MLPLLDGKRCTTHVKFIIIIILKSDDVPARPVAMHEFYCSYGRSGPVYTDISSKLNFNIHYSTLHLSKKK